jgi:shikimate dehydrogenase
VSTLRLGLIGGNITQSRSPALQIVCGLSVGLNVSYDLLIPDVQQLSFQAMLQRCKDAGFDGVNVTYPYKEQVLKYIAAGDTTVSELGAANTVRFSASGDTAWNTDSSGFIAAYRTKFGAQSPGRTLLIGAGGVGRAIAFALRHLNATEILIYDTDISKAEKLSLACNGNVAQSSQLAILDGIDGVVNCTPLGMRPSDADVLPPSTNGTPRWAFDAIYTPEHTRFRAQVEALGAQFLSGYELYFNQGIQGFRIFSGHEVTRTDWVRSVLSGAV